MISVSGHAHGAHITKKLALCFALLIAVASATAPTAAQEASGWSEDHASRARLIVGDAEGDSRLIGLEIVMDEGYKTYWRHPGDSGLPPEFDWSRSTNLADIEVLFPGPRRYEDASGVFFGYSDAVIFPIRITPRDPALPLGLSLSLEYGVCKEICIPARAELELAPTDPARAHADAVAGGLAQVPIRQELGAAGDFAVTHVDAGRAGKLMVGVRAPQDALLLAEGPDYRWFLAPDEAMQQGAGSDSDVFVVEVAERPAVVEGPVRLVFTLVADDRAIETVVELSPDELPTR